jgi:hypothetical protein
MTAATANHPIRQNLFQSRAPVLAIHDNRLGGAADTRSAVDETKNTSTTPFPAGRNSQRPTISGDGARNCECSAARGKGDGRGRQHRPPQRFLMVSASDSRTLDRDRGIGSPPVRLRCFVFFSTSP